MRIELVGQDKVFAGTPRQILMQMKSLTPGAQHLSLREFIEGNVANVSRASSIQVSLEGETDEELAESLVAQMLQGGYAKTL
jgi:hypothetical protein